MNKFIIVLMAASCLSGCETAPPVPVSALDGLDLCSRYVNGSLRYSYDEMRKELARRGENCQQHLPIIQARNQANAQDAAAQGALGMQLLQQAQPRPVQQIQPQMGISCQTRYFNGVAYTNCN